MTIRQEVKQRLEILEPSEYPDYQEFCTAVAIGRDLLPRSVMKALFSRMALAIMAPDPADDFTDRAHEILKEMSVSVRYTGL